MNKWSQEKANSWYEKQEWLVGCNFLPSTAINQLEMFQDDTFDIETIKREIFWASDLGFNSLRIYLHDLLWENKKSFTAKLDNLLDICSAENIKPIEAWVQLRQWKKVLKTDIFSKTKKIPKN